MHLRSRVHLEAWSSKRETARTILDLDAAHAKIVRLETMAGSDRIVATVEETPVDVDGRPLSPLKTTILTSASGGPATRVFSEPEDLALSSYLQLSSKRPVGVILSSYSTHPRTMRFFGADGRLGPTLRLADGTDFDFSSEGLPGVMTTTKDAKGRAFGVFRLLDMATGRLGEVAEPETRENVAYESSGIAATRLEQKPPSLFAAITPDPRPGIYLIVDGKTETAGLVTTDGTMPVLSPRNDALAFLTGKGASVRALLKVDRKAYQKAMDATAREQALAYAKQIGTGMKNYASDADDEFPPPGSDAKETVYPYVRDRAALDGFVYSHSGPGSDLGYIPAPGGRAVIHEDGTVTWVPDGF